MGLRRGQLFAFSLALVVTTILAAVIIARWVESSRANPVKVQATDAPTATTAEPAADAPTAEELDKRRQQLRESLGTDDGFVASFFYGSSIQGNLETCG